MQGNRTAAPVSGKTIRGGGMFLAVLWALLPCPAVAAKSSSAQMVKIVAQIQRADYEGDRAALIRLYDQLMPFVSNKEVGARVRYWRGFALWRRALNGANESVKPAELDSDLKQAVVEFREAISADATFVDARIAAASCLFFRLFLNRGDNERVKEFLPEAMQWMKDAQTAAPDNPRFLWVQGGTFWYLPPERGGGETKAMETYQKGLESARKQSASTDPLNPSWGEPELLMNLSWSSLHASKPDPDAAEAYANEALKRIPYWHYVRDILLPQIQSAKQKH